MRRTALIAGSVLLALLGACESSSETRMVPIESWADAPVPSLDTLITLGGAEASGPEAFGSIRNVIFLDSTERIAVADQMSNEIHIFSLDGRHVATLGGSGGGPGEFGALTDLVLVEGDRLGAWDFEQMRYTEFGPSGTVLSTHRVEVVHSDPRYPSFVGVFPDARVVLEWRRATYVTRGSEPGFYVDTIPYVAHSFDQGTADTLVKIPGPEEQYREEENSWGFVPKIFGRTPVSVVQADQLFVGLNDHVQLQAVPADGSSGGSVQLPFERESTTEEDIDLEIERRIDQLYARPVRAWDDAGRELTQEINERDANWVRAADTEESWPLLDQIIPGNKGLLWVRAYPRHQDRETLWVALAPSGEVRWRLRLERSARIAAASGPLLAVKAQDSFGTGRIVVLRLRDQ